MKRFKKIMKYVATLFLVLLVSLCIYTFVVTDIMKKDYVNVFGYTYFVVATGSMSGTIEVDDIIFVRLTDDVDVNDVITFKSKDGDIITHRLIKKEGSRYITKGDVNNVIDEAITKDQIIGRVDMIVSPSFILKSIAAFLIIFIFLALVNFDGVVKKFILRSDSPKTEKPKVEEKPEPVKEIPKIENKKEGHKKAENLVEESTPEEPVKEEVKKVETPKEEPVKEEAKKVETPKEEPVKEEKEKKKEKSVPRFLRERPKIPEAIFTSAATAAAQSQDEHTGLTVMINLDDMERLERSHEKEIEQEDSIEVLDSEDYFSYLPNKKKATFYREKETVDLVVSILKCKSNNTTKTKMNKKWLTKFQYVYKLCHLLLLRNTERMVEEISHPPFKEIFDYNLDTVGLTETIRDRIFDMPISIFLRILTYSILYNDEEMFDGVFKILKYKVMFDKNNDFREIKNVDVQSTKQIKTLIQFMKKVSDRFDNKNVFELDRIERLAKIDNY